MHLANGEYLNPAEQSYLQWDPKQEFLDSVVRMNPDVLQGLRDTVFPKYPTEEMRAAIYFFRHYSRFASCSPSSINQEIPRFAYRMALGVSPSVSSWRLGPARQYLDSYPAVPGALAFTGHDWDAANALQDLERKGSLPFKRTDFIAAFEERVPASSRLRFASALAGAMHELRGALESWGAHFGIAVPWIYSNALETMFYGAFTPRPDWFPNADRWEYTDDHYFSANPPSPPTPDLVTRHSFIWDPRKERRKEARSRLSKLGLPSAQERELVGDISKVAGAYQDAGWYQAPLSRLEQHHFDWTALAITKHLTTEQMLEAYMDRKHELGEWQDAMDEEPSLSTIHRGIRQVCKLIDLPNPLHRGRPRKVGVA